MRLICLVLVWVALAAPQSAFALIGANDTVPAATLLLPYFEADLANASSINTIFAVNNADVAAAIAHVTLWTDHAVPTLGFDIPLVGFDVQTVSLRDVFEGTLPNGTALSEEQLAALVAAHTGEADPVSGLCSAANFGDSIARGYITIDSTNAESALLPTDAGYFVAGGTGIANNNNVLWGDFSYIEPANNLAQSERLVHIEASSTDPAVTTSGNPTFYGTYVANTAADNREPLKTLWASPYDQRSNVGATTHFIYWRDPQQLGSTAACGVPPAPFPLSVAEIVAFDEFENAVSVDESNLFPNACGRQDLGAMQFEFEKGWVYINLNIEGSSVLNQSYVLTVLSTEGRFSSMTPALPLDDIQQ